VHFEYDLQTDRYVTESYYHTLCPDMPTNLTVQVFNITMEDPVIELFTVDISEFDNSLYCQYCPSTYVLTSNSNFFDIVGLNFSIKSSANVIGNIGEQYLQLSSTLNSTEN
jgi:hypothetical protein